MENLVNIDTEKIDDGEENTLLLSLKFKENEFFKNEVLTVKIQYDPLDDEQIKKIEGTEIDWAYGEDPTFNEV